jgi:hypothetical protein
MSRRTCGRLPPRRSGAAIISKALPGSQRSRSQAPNCLEGRVLRWSLSRIMSAGSRWSLTLSPTASRPAAWAGAGARTAGARPTRQQTKQQAQAHQGDGFDSLPLRTRQKKNTSAVSHPASPLRTGDHRAPPPGGNPRPWQPYPPPFGKRQHLRAHQFGCKHCC